MEIAVRVLAFEGSFQSLPLPWAIKRTGPQESERGWPWLSLLWAA